ncbi:MAG: hypothetical protein CR993_01760 [Rhodobacterales bacterium]|nr:MAG: hypothetical protein CR993_01760 [Rhodobacterales bacterium]
MKRFAFLAAMMLSLLGGAPAMAQDVIDSYVAYIGRADLYNSKGTRLRQPWQILRQDRANFHRFGISQDGDEWDSFFASMKNRGIMERMVRDGYIEPSAARAIVGGGAYVLVRIYGHGSRGEYVGVTVFD